MLEVGEAMWDWDFISFVQIEDAQRFWTHCGSVNYTNVYNDREFKREREEQVIQNCICQIFVWWYFGDTIPFSLTKQFDGHQAQAQDQKFTNVIVGHSK